MLNEAWRVLKPNGLLGFTVTFKISFIQFRFLEGEKNAHFIL